MFLNVLNSTPARASSGTAPAKTRAGLKTREGFPISSGTPARHLLEVTTTNKMAGEATRVRADADAGRGTNFGATTEKSVSKTFSK